MYSIDDTTTSTVTGSWKVIKIDLSDYSKVGHGHQIIDVEDLESQLDSKATVNHTHDIAHILKLSDTLEKKSDVGHTHDVNTITNITKLSTLEDVNILSLSLSKSSDDKDYTISVDDNNCLNIYYNELRIAQYTPSTKDWVFGDYSMSKIDETLENHYQVLQVIIKALKEHDILVDEEQGEDE